MKVIVTFDLMNSATRETPDTIKNMVKNRIDEIMERDLMMGLFVRGYAVEVSG